MIRKTIIVVLAMLAASSAIAFPLSFPWVFGYTDGAGTYEVNFGSLRILLTDLPALSLSSSHWYWADNVLPRELTPYMGPSGRPLTFLPIHVKNTAGVWGLDMPLWIIFVTTSTYPIVAFSRGRRRRLRHRKSLCLRCGYDLTGNVTGKCSECGASV